MVDIIFRMDAPESVTATGQPMRCSWRITNLATPNSTLTKFAALFNITADDSDDLLGKKCFVQVQHRPGENNAIHARVIKASLTKPQYATEIFDSPDASHD